MSRRRERHARGGAIPIGGLVLLLTLFSLAAPSLAAEYRPQGFGATTPGGAGGAVVRVTTLADAGPGSLRAALAGGRRTIVFDVAGEIELLDHLYVGGAFVTVDGTTAPAPGITLKNRGLIIRGTRGAHDVIVRGLRIRGASIDGIQISYGAYNVVIDHVSIHGAGDGNLDITENSRDVTVQWSVFAEPAAGKNMLIKYHPSRVTLHHNLFVKGLTRNPNVSIDNDAPPATDTTLDMRNNVVWDWGVGWGSELHNGVRANVVNNYYASPASRAGDRRQALVVDRATARVHVSGNVSGDGVDLSALGNEAAPLPAPPIDPEDACTAARAVLAGAGVRPLDALDQSYFSAITLPGCPAPPPPPPPPPPPSSLEVNPARADFRAIAGGPAPAPLTLGVSDGAGGALSWTAAVEAPWLRLQPGSGLTPGSTALRVDAGALPAGTYAGTVVVTAEGVSNSPRLVPVTLTIAPPAGSEQSVGAPVRTWGDDGSESSSGYVRLNDRSLKVGRGYTVVLRLAGVPVPRGARIERAVLKLFALGIPDRILQLTYAAEAADSSAALAAVARDVSRRPLTVARVADSPAPWAAEAWNASPDLSAVIQELVDRPGWVPGEALTLVILDRGSSSTRTIASHDRFPVGAFAPVLELTYR